MVFLLKCCAESCANGYSNADANGYVAHRHAERGADASTNCDSCTYSIHVDGLLCVTSGLSLH